MLFLGIPLSTKIKDNLYYQKISVKGKVVSALLSQIRVFSGKRIQDKLAELDKGDFIKTKTAIEKILFSPSTQ